MTATSPCLPSDPTLPIVPPSHPPRALRRWVWVLAGLAACGDSASGEGGGGSGGDTTSAQTTSATATSGTTTPATGAVTTATSGGTASSTTGSGGAPGHCADAVHCGSVQGYFCHEISGPDAAFEQACADELFGQFAPGPCGPRYGEGACVFDCVEPSVYASVMAIDPTECEMSGGTYVADP